MIAILAMTETALVNRSKVSELKCFELTTNFIRLEPVQAGKANYWSVDLIGAPNE